MATFIFDSLVMNGCSARHGRHQEANTLTTEISPALKSALENPLPYPCGAPLSMGGRENSGTGLSISAEGMIFGSLVRPMAK